MTKNLTATVTANPEIDRYLDAFGTFGAYKSEIDPPEIPVNRRAYKHRDHDFRVQAKRTERTKKLAKRAKNARIWDDVVRKEGTATRYYSWEPYEVGEDQYWICIRNITERHDAVRVRKAIGKSQERFVEVL